MIPSFILAESRRQTAQDPLDPRNIIVRADDESYERLEMRLAKKAQPFSPFESFFERRESGKLFSDFNYGFSVFADYWAVDLQIKNTWSFYSGFGFWQISRYGVSESVR